VACFCWGRGGTTCRAGSRTCGARLGKWCNRCRCGTQGLL
jgi:hypothetical protein